MNKENNTKPLTQYDYETWEDQYLNGSKPVSDPVNHPTHYNSGGIECIEAIKASMNSDQFIGYLKGNVVKYVWRFDKKGKPVEDLEKAVWYIRRLIEEVEMIDTEGEWNEF